VVFPLTKENLEQTAELWTPEMVREWFAKNPRMMFYYVPQVACYQEGGIPVDPAWVEPPPGEEPPRGI